MKLSIAQIHAALHQDIQADASPGGKIDAMKEELGALQKNKTWDLLPLPAGKRAVGCKWVFTVKQTPEGKVDR